MLSTGSSCLDSLAQGRRADSSFSRSSHHNRYKHDFKKLIETDSVMKNYCSILQELLRLRQICVHMSLVRDSEDLAQNGGVVGGGDLTQTIDKHGISKPRAMQLLGLLRDAGGAQCAECGHDMIPAGAAGASNGDDEEDKVDRKLTKKVRKTNKSATTSAACSDNDDAALANECKSVVTRCQHLFCRVCFKGKIYANWPDSVDPNDRANCTVCKADLTPALDAVEIGAREMERAFEAAADEDLAAATTGKKLKGTRFFEHSTKTKCVPSFLSLLRERALTWRLVKGSLGGRVPVLAGEPGVGQLLGRHGPRGSQDGGDGRDDRVPASQGRGRQVGRVLSVDEAPRSVRPSFAFLLRFC